MRIIIDLDGTLCELRKEGQSYANLRPNRNAIEKVRLLKKAGHTIIIQTARHMKTHEGNLEMVIKTVGDETKRWLAQHEIAYDELHFGKQHGDVYIDDLAFPFQEWESADLSTFDDGMTNIVIPMAGRGFRFKEAGYTSPKPLIDVLGKPMIEWAMQTFDFIRRDSKHRFIFIINADDDVRHRLGEQLRALFQKRPIEIIIIPEVTRGQAETCLMARNYINNYGRLYVHNCDTYVASDIGKVALREDVEGALVCFESTDPHLSYAHLDEFGYVDMTAEKKVISTLASTGLYYFRHGRDFVAAADKIISQDVRAYGEFYVAPCYNELIGTGKRILTCMASDYAVLGTPRELETFARTNRSV